MLFGDVEVDVGDDCHLAEAAAMDDASRGMRDLRGARVGDHPVWLPLAVDVVAADQLVQLQELFESDLAGVERIEAVLDAEVVVRSLA